MFRSSDNPKLFVEVAKAYKLACPEDKSFNPYFVKELSDEQLAKIKTLEIKASDFTGIRSLAGLEKLVNLERFSLQGQDAREHAREFKTTAEKAEKMKNFDAEREYDYYAREYDSCQISDVTPIYELKNLKSLDLSNQRSITEFDFSHNSNLTQVNMQNCKGLKKISGLERLTVFRDPSKLDDPFAHADSKFDFSGCHSLKSVGSMRSIVEVIEKNSETAASDAHLFFPTTTYCHVMREEPEIGEKLNVLEENQWPVAKWTEIGPGGVRIEDNSRQMTIAKRYADDTIRTIFEGQELDSIDQVAGVYRWICDNIKYDNEGLATSKGQGADKRLDMSNKIRSSYVALLDKKSVCAGVSNLFNFMLADLGFHAESVSCSSDRSGDARATISNHQISKIRIAGHDYYCDPTWDLGEEVSKFFCLNKEEMEKTHQFTVADLKVKCGESYQDILRELGLLKTKQTGIQME